MQRLIEILERHGFEALIATRESNGAYITGFRGLNHTVFETPQTSARSSRAGSRRRSRRVLRVERRHFEMGWAGVHVKETVLVTNDGARSLNRSNRGLVVLD